MTAKRRRTLDLVERMLERDRSGKKTPMGKRYYTRQDHVRAELRRVARQVRGLKNNEVRPTHFSISYVAAIDDVLAILKEAEK